MYPERWMHHPERWMHCSLNKTTVTQFSNVYKTNFESGTSSKAVPDSKVDIALEKLEDKGHKIVFIDTWGYKTHKIVLYPLGEWRCTWKIDGDTTASRDLLDCHLQVHGFSLYLHLFEVVSAPFRWRWWFCTQ